MFEIVLKFIILVLAVIVVWVDYSWLPPFVIIKFAIVILVIEIRQKWPPRG